MGVTPGCNIICFACCGNMLCVQLCGLPTCCQGGTLWALFIGSMLVTCPIMLGSMFHASSTKVIKFEDFRIEYRQFHSGMRKLKKKDYKKSFRDAVERDGWFTDRGDFLELKGRETLRIRPRFIEEEDEDFDWQKRFISFFLTTINKKNAKSREGNTKWFLEGVTDCSPKSCNTDRRDRRYKLLTAREVKDEIRMGPKHRRRKVNIGGIINSLGPNNTYLGVLHPYKGKYFFSNYDGLVRLAKITGSHTASLGKAVRRKGWFWRSPMGKAIQYTGPIYWVILATANVFYYSYWGLSSAFTWFGTNSGLLDTLKPTPWVPSKFVTSDFAGGWLEHWVNGFGSFLEDHENITESEEDEDEESEEKESKERDSKGDSRDTEDDEEKPNRATVKPEKKKSLFQRVHIGVWIGLAVGIFVIIILLAVCCYCALASSGDVVMYDVENPRRRRRSSRY